MQLDRMGVFEGEEKAARQERGAGRGQGNGRLRALATIALTLASCLPSSLGQTPAGTKGPDSATSNPPGAPVPAPMATEPFSLRDTERNFSRRYATWLGNPVKIYRPTTIPKASFVNSVRLTDLMKNGKIYLSLSDAIALALENNYDIAIARYDLDIADTDILRAKTGSSVLGAPSGLLTGTLGGSPTILTTGGGPGGSTVGSGGAGSGVNGLTLTTAGAGPTPANLEPTLGGAIQFDRDHLPPTSFFSTGTSSTNTYNFTFNQGFVTGTNMQVAFNNTYTTTNNTVTSYSPELLSTYKLTVTQQLLQGAGIWVNKRFQYQAINDRRIVDSSFRQQILYTVNQVENIYWGLVQAYEDQQSKERALDQSSKLDSDDKQQLQIGTIAPLQVVQDDSAVASDKQALISSQSNLTYQQLIIKQAIARNLNDPVLAAAPVIPTDRVSIEELPEESEPIQQLVQEAFQRRPELEQAVLTLRNDEITLKGARNALLPTFNVYGYLEGQGVAGSINKNLNSAFCTGGVCPTSPGGYGTAFDNAFNNSSPDKGMGFNIQIPIRNRLAQSMQERSLMEYRQAELRLAQLYTQIQIQVMNARYALTNDRAAVRSATASRDYAEQSVEAEKTKLRLGASTSANVLLQERTLATAEDTLIAANAAYAKDRAGLYQVLATTLQEYGIDLTQAATGQVKTDPVVPGVKATAPGREPTMTPPAGQ